MTTQRRLAAIFVSDVVGFSRLIGDDEAGTLARLAALRREIVEPSVARHAGRLFKQTGDGFLVEFASAVEAVSCAVEIQKAAGADSSLPLRIGIHVGDVVVQGDDLMGDGVNIAARIEGVADVGGIAISRQVHDQVRDRLDVPFVDKGEVELKNLARPVHVFAVTDTKAAAATTPALALPDKPSIAVLPFQNMSGDPEQEYFADGMVEDIITALSRFKSLFVIARNSSFSYKGKSPDIRQVGRELGVRYVLEGSVRKAGGRVRITGQLIDAASGTHLWADRFDGAVEEVFELQDKVASNVAVVIAPRVERAELERARAKSIGNPGAYDLLLRALNLVRTRPGRVEIEEALRLLNQAVDLDPGYARAFVNLSFCCWLFVTQGFGHRDHPLVVDVMVPAAQKALTLDRLDARVVSVAALILGLPGGDMATAMALIESAIALNPNEFNAFLIGSLFHAYQGQLEKALEYHHRAGRLNPANAGGQAGMGDVIAYFGVGAYDNVLESTARILSEWPSTAGALRYRAASLALLGHVEEARQVVARILAQTPGYSVAEVRRHFEFDIHNPFKVPGFTESLYRGLRLAGLPE